MTSTPLYRMPLLIGVSSAALMNGVPAAAQEERAPEEREQAREETDFGSGSGLDAGEIVVSGQRLRGQLDVEQEPILELAEADIAAEGVTSIADLITQITNQTGSARGRGGGGRPVILINGIRVGSFREFANYPPEALEKVEVFPEEVAQRFGFPPDRRVINLILKENYRNAEVELEFEGPSRGGYYQREQELGFLQIANGARINFNFEAQDNSILTENERDIIQTPGSISDVAGDPDQAAFRSLVSDNRGLEANLSYAKAIIDSGISLSANVNYERNDARRLQGLNSVILTDASGNSAFRTFGAATPLEQVTAQDVLQSSGSLTKPVNGFRLTSTFDAGFSETTRRIDNRFDVSGFQSEALAGTLALDGALPDNVDAGFETAFTRTMSAQNLTTLRGPLAQLPGGELLATFDLGYDWTRLESTDTRTATGSDLTRGDLSAGMNLVIPITSRRNGFADALGSFTLNGQIGLNRLSDFGTLGDYTVGLTWAPFDNLDLSATYIEREVAPGLSALGDPQVENLNTPVFDFTTGETVLATVITGGNPDLLAETQRDWKFAANWQLPFWRGARFTAEYIKNRSDDVTSGFPQITPEIEAAFPGRIIRDGGGQIVSVDQRSVTFAETRADRLQFRLSLRGSIGAGESGGRPGARGGAPSGRPTGRPAQSSPPSAPPAAAQASAQASAPERPQGRGPGGGGPPSAEQRAAFTAFREQICADDGLEVLFRMAEAAANGEDMSATFPGFSSRRFERILSRVRGPDGSIDPERLAQARERICSMGPERMGPPTRAGEGREGEERRGPRREGFAAFRALACADDGAAKIKALIARIEAGEDVSDELPGFDPAMAGPMLDRLRGEDGSVSDERIAQLRARFCESEGGAGGASGGAQAGGGGGPPGGFNPLARRTFPGFRYFLNLTHTIELENTILIAEGLAPLDQLDGQATSAFGLPRHSSRLEAGIFGSGVGMRASARYTGSTRLDGTGQVGSTDLFFDDLATFDLRVFFNVDQVLKSDSEALSNLRVSLRADNIFDARRTVTDNNGETPINFQPFLIDPVGRFIGIDIRKLF